MTATADRMRNMRDRRRKEGLRELRILVPDARMPGIRQRVARQVAALSPSVEQDALVWIEMVSEFDETR